MTEMEPKKTQPPARGRRWSRAAVAGAALALAGAVMATPAAYAALPDLAVTIAGPATATHGGTATYTVTATNNGAATATNVVVRYLLVDKSGQALPKPASLTPLGGSTIDAAAPSVGGCTIGTVVTVSPVGPVGPAGPVAPSGYTLKTATCRLGSLTAGSSATVTIGIGVQLNTFVEMQPVGVIGSQATLYSDDNAADDATEAATIAQRVSDEATATNNVAQLTTTVTP